MTKYSGVQLFSALNILISSAHRFINNNILQLSVINNDRSHTGPKLITNPNGSHINTHTFSECHIEHKQIWENVARLNTGTHGPV